ncbi:MAG: choice-of-anchor Q domain-containing protein [Chloroflexota bacterium]
MTTRTTIDNKARYALFFCLAIVWGVGAVGSQAGMRPERVNAPFTVNSTLDAVDAFPGNGVCATAAGECTLRAAVMEANALPGNDTIVLPAGDYTITMPGTGEDAAVTGDLDITGDLAIQGAGLRRTVVTGNSIQVADRVFDVHYSVAASIADLTIRDGSAHTYEDGGAGFRNRGTLTLTNSAVTENASGSYEGGGIFNSGVLTILNSTVSGNTMTNAQEVKGGGIFNAPNGVLIVVNSGIFNNSIDAHNAYDPAQAFGGGIFNHGSLTLTNSVVAFNEVDSTSSFSTATSQAGGVYNDRGSTLRANNSTISGNVVTGSEERRGGGIFNYSAAFLNNVTISQNSAAEGAGIYNRSDGGNISLQNTIVNNTCSGTILSAGYNLISSTANCNFLFSTGDLLNANPLLGPLRLNGGRTPTHALLVGSPAIDAGNPAGCADENGNLFSTDQRQYVRHVEGDGYGPIICDMGAYEYASTNQPDFQLFTSTPSRMICAGDEAYYALTIDSILGYNQPVTLSATGLPPGVTATFDPNPVIPTADSALTLGNTGGLSADSYDVTVSGEAAASPLLVVHGVTVELAVNTAVPGQPQLQEPADGATDVSLRPTFSWTAASQALTYTLTIATDPAFNDMVYTADVEGLSHTPAEDLSYRTLYYWRVQAHNTCGPSVSSPVFSFMTLFSDFGLAVEPGVANACVPADAVYNVIVSGYGEEVTLTAGGHPAGTTAAFDPNPLLPPVTSLLTLTGTGAAAPGSYTLTITGTTDLTTHTTTAGLNLFSTTPAVPSLLTPTEGQVSVPLQPLFTWEAATQGLTYTLAIAADAGFTNVVYTATTTDLSHTPTLLLEPSATYYWRVQAQNACGSGSYSSVFSFTTRSLTFTVNSTLDTTDANPGDGQCLTVGGVCTLRAAVQESNAGTGAVIIALPAGVYSLTLPGLDDAAATGDLDLTGQVVISGTDATTTIIDGNYPVTDDRVFQVQSQAAVTMVGVTIRGGRASEGGGIYNSGTLTITASTLSDNHSTATFLAGGGAIHNSGSLVVTSSTLFGNTSADRGGAIYTTQVIATPSAIVDNSTLSGNTAGYGGAIFANNGPVMVFNSTVTANDVNHDGGGVYEVDSTVTLRNTLWAGNTATINGDNCWGGVGSEGYNLLGNDDRCFFASATGDQVGTPANPIDPLLASLQDNGGPTWTHALLLGSPAVDTGHPTLCPAADQRGHVRPADGDANGSLICDVGAYEFTASNQPEFSLDIAPVTALVCAPASAAYDVSVFATLGFSQPVTLSAAGQPAGTTATFSPNPVTPPGDSVLTIDDTAVAPAGTYTIDITGTALTTTHSVTVGLELFTMAPPAPQLTAPADGATDQPLQMVFQWQPADQATSYAIEVATDNSFNNLVESASGLAATTYTAATILEHGTTYYWRVWASNICGDGSYSGVYRFQTLGATFTVNSTADAVDIDPGDGQCATAAGECTLRAAIQEANALTPLGTKYIILPAATYTLTIPGAGENSAATGDLDITNRVVISGTGSATTIIDANSPVTGDRALDILADVTVTLSGVTVRGGQAEFGGGIYNEGVLTVIYSTVTANHTTGMYGGGGGIYQEGATAALFVEDSLITGNTSEGYGGGIYGYRGVGDSHISVQNSTISDNSARTGGGIYNWQNVGLTVSDSTISGNSATENGGGVSSTESVTITNSLIYGNTADAGGGIASDGGDRGSTIQDSLISGNTATIGGGIRHDGGTLEITGSTVYSNTANNYGGGLALYEGNLDVINSTVSGNSAGDWGGGLYIAAQGSQTVLVNVTITANTADTAAGISQAIDPVYFKHTLVADNQALTAYPDCQGILLSSSYNLLGNNEGCTVVSAEGDQIGTPENPIDPLLGYLQDNGGPTLTHALLPGSPAIDAGDPIGCTDGQFHFLTADQRGYPRPADGDGHGPAICDIGAFEVQPVPGDFFCSTPNLSIPDNNPAGVSDDLILTDTGSITDLNVSLVVSHTWVGDLLFTLEHVDTGTTVTLIDRPGWPPPPSCSGDDIDATLDDEGVWRVEDVCSPVPPAISGLLIPNNPLSAFDGEDLSGTWRLTAADLAANDVGTLTQWCLAAEADEPYFFPFAPPFSDLELLG